MCTGRAWKKLLPGPSIEEGEKGPLHLPCVALEMVATQRLTSCVGCACVQISSRFIGLSNVSVAFLALSLHLLFGVLSWRDCLEYTPAWDTLLWFGVVIGMSTNLNTLVTATVFCSQLNSQLCPYC